ncbi:hypothetical protein [Desulfovibrio sp.]|uniref:type II restriction enzyme n=1 Tax=Desulfovibrio sp. TaxID=885 RepID=UPI0023CC9080|nr:hypothetical protein [Desulfovibrio sp.]MDE7242130.1 hypothetical protein [Desulfovibrio sp.]
MSDKDTLNNEKAWKCLFGKYNILDHIATNGSFTISASAIKEFREPRLMTKFDHWVNLPSIFQENNLAILPTARGEYIISHFAAYHKLEPFASPITQCTLPTFLESINPAAISSEAVALNCAVAAGILSDFLGEDEIYATVSGRMGSGVFSFKIDCSTCDKIFSIVVRNSQIEIDAAYEGIESLAIFEAKRDISEDFLIRQLYYPFRVLKTNLKKQIRPIFMIFSNRIYRFFEYKFDDINNYNSLHLIKQKNYSIEPTAISMRDIETIFSGVSIEPEPQVPFPQADRFERVINICELLQNSPLTDDEITEVYAFNSRQTRYYTDAGRYLGLIEKETKVSLPAYKLSEKGKNVIKKDFRERQLAFCECILQHVIFHEVMRRTLQEGDIPDKGAIISLMQAANLFQIGSDSTFIRRASTVRSWISWIFSLKTEV